MNNRLVQFLSAENISQSQLADKIGVARASISHIVAGRNKPGFDFIESMMSNFPALNIEWLITGKGKMYKTQAKSEPEVGSLFGLEEAGPRFQTADNSQPNASATNTMTSIPGQNPAAVITPLPNSSAINEMTTSYRPTETTAKQRVITKITVFYSDNTFEEIQ